MKNMIKKMMMYVKKEFEIGYYEQMKIYLMCFIFTLILFISIKPFFTLIIKIYELLF